MEKFDLENFPTSDSAKKMLSYVSDGFYDKSYVGKWIYQVMGIEYDMALEIVADLPAQFFPETATWGLMFHEIKWGLPVRENLSYEERRRLIYQKRDCRSPMTPYFMEEYLKTATGLDVYVADAHDSGPYNYKPEHPNIFKVFFKSDTTLDVKRIKSILDRLKQSHTIYVIDHYNSLVVDNHGLEQFRTYRLDLHIKIAFWKSICLDGTWKLDGSKKLDGIHQMIPVKASLKMAVNNPAGEPEYISVSVKKNLWHLDGSVKLDGSRLLNADEWKEKL